MYLKNEDTICAPATIPGTGAISIIRISGPEAFSIVDSIVTFKKGSVSEAKGYTMKFGTILYEGGKILDEVIACIFRAPHSYTGEHSVELSCHASKYIVSQIMLLLLGAGARMADPGEFTQRAFLNGKMDLAQAEAVADVISSQNAASHRIAFNQMKGGFSDELKKMRSDLLHLVSLMELELDFSEEDVEFADRTELNQLLDAVIAHISRLIDSFRLGNAIKNGVPVAIAGSTNAGKSTLLNALLGEERAIVSDIHGTTRDTIEEVMNVDGILFRFIDTAGIRETSEIIEKIGIERTFKKIQEADIILGMIDASTIVEPDDASTSRGEERVSIEEKLHEILSAARSDSQKIFILLNKADRMDSSEIDSLISRIKAVGEDKDFEILTISARTGAGLDLLRTRLADYQKELISDTDTTLVTNLRHVEALTAARESLSRVRSGLAAGIPTDLAAQDIREGILSLNDIVGDISTDEILGNIFKNFCVGK